jgi:hypothetical protein
MSELVVGFAINAAWQAAVIAAVGLLLARLLHPRHAFQLLALALVASTIAPLLTLFAPRAVIAAAGAMLPPVPARGAQLTALAYAIGFAFCAMRLLCAAWRARRIVAASVPVSSRKRLSYLIRTPVTIGRTIILPPFVVDDERLFAAAVAHEDAHVRRHDYLVHLALELFALPLYFHPLSHLLRRAIADARELACDEDAAARCGRREYAAALVQIASRTRGAVGMNMAAASIERRVAALVNPDTPRHRGRLAPIAMLFVAAAACTRFDATPPVQTLQGRWELIRGASDFRAMVPSAYEGYTQTISQGPRHLSVRQRRTVNGRTQTTTWTVVTDGVLRPIDGVPRAQGVAVWRDGKLELKLAGPGAHRENATAFVRGGRLVCDGATERGTYHAEFRRTDR